MASSSPVYLDHAGAGQYLPEQIEAISRELTSTLLSNPHSRSASSKLTTDLIDQMRYRILEYFNTTITDYSLIFTSGSTASLKLIAESLDWTTLCPLCAATATANTYPQATFTSKHDWLRPGPKLAYLTDNHTSAVGMRQFALDGKVATIHCIHPDLVDEFIRANSSKGPDGCNCTRLFVFPAQSNYSGTKYMDRGWIQRFRDINYSVCLDAAAFLSTNPYDLSIHESQPDFMVLSFYKLFGFPTGLGALLVRNHAKAAGLMTKKKYFGGGTVMVALNGRDFVKFRDEQPLCEKFEDGTLAFQQILALKHGFEAMERRSGITRISTHTFALARYSYDVLTKLKHANGSPIAVVYCDSDFSGSQRQGPIVNFNLLRPDGTYVGYAEADKLAELYDVHWRSGCFCNLGACQLYLGLSDEVLMKNFESGKICGDKIDLIDGRPVGSIRISFGWTSTTSDVEHFIRMIWECFVDRGSPKMTLDRALIHFGIDSNPKHRIDADRTEIEANGFQKCDDTKEEDREEFFEARDHFHGSQSINRNIARSSTNGHIGLHLTDIYVYPVKSCSPIRFDEWRISERGLRQDRRWMIVTRDGLCLNQKREPRMCTIKPTLTDDDRLLLRCDRIDRDLSIPAGDSKEAGDIRNGVVSDTAIAGPYCQSKVCADRVSTKDCGDVVGVWIDQVLERSGCRLVAQTDDIPRKGKGGGEEADVSLANEEQYLLLHRASIRRLLALIRATSPHITEDDLILRFRPNLVVDNGTPFEEDAWKRLRIGDIEFQCVGKCTRCQMICVDQNTGEMDKNVLLALRELRNSKLTFGIYLQSSLANVGKSIRVNQEVVILDRE